MGSFKNKNPLKSRNNTLIIIFVFNKNGGNNKIYK